MNEYSHPESSEQPGTELAEAGYRSGALRRTGGNNVVAMGYDGVGTDEGSGYLQLWRTILKWRWVVIGTFAAVISLAVIVTLLTTPVYRATSTLEIASEELRIIDTEDSASSSVSMARADYMQTQYALLESRNLAERVARNLNLANQEGFGFAEGERPPRNAAAAVNRATRELTKNFVVKPVGQSRLVAISYDSHDRALATRIINGFASAFIESTLDRKMGSTTQTRAILERRLAEAKARLEVSERAATAYARSAGIINIQQGGGADVDTGATSLDAASLSELNSALAQAQQDRIAAEQRYRQSAATTTEELTNPTIQSLLSRRSELSAEISEKSNIYRDNFPQMEQMRSRIADIDASIAREKNRIRTALSSEYRGASAREAQLQGRVNALKGSVLNLNDRGIQYNILRREVDTNRQFYDALLNRFKEVDVQSDTGTSNVSIVDEAIEANQIRPNPLFNLALGSLLGLVLGLIGAFICEFMDDSVKTPDDVAQKLHIPLLGAIPRVPNSQKVVDEIADPQSMISEAYFSVRTSIEFGTSSGAPRSILFTSSRPGEGKSVTSYALANAFARIGAKVLLVDADMRKPTLKVGEEGGHGLSNLLTGSSDYEGAIFATSTPNLSVMPSGPVPPNPAELLASRRVAEVLADLLEQFDHVLLDGPPVMGLADAPLLSSISEGTIFIMEGGIRRLTARRALARLVSADAQLLGGVLTKFDARAHGLGYGYGYGYGYSYAYGRKADAYGRRGRSEETHIVVASSDPVA